MPERRDEVQSAYDKGQREAAKRLAQIGKLLQELPISDNGEAVINWATVSTQAEINCRLAAIVSFLRGDEE